MPTDSDRAALLRHVHSTPSRQRELILDAMAAADPDTDGDLMRHLETRGVGDVVRQAMRIAQPGRRGGRSRYVQGWRPD